MYLRCFLRWFGSGLVLRRFIPRASIRATQIDLPSKTRLSVTAVKDSLSQLHNLLFLVDSWCSSTLAGPGWLCGTTVGRVSPHF